MYNLTQTVETENHGTLVVPCDPYKFGKAVEYQQEKTSYHTTHTILFNKGRYFETSIYNPLVLKEISELTHIPVQHTNMIVGSWKQMEDFVIAMNCLGIRVKIDIDWI